MPLDARRAASPMASPFNGHMRPSGLSNHGTGRADVPSHDNRPLATVNGHGPSVHVASDTSAASAARDLQTPSTATSTPPVRCVPIRACVAATAVSPSRRLRCYTWTRLLFVRGRPGRPRGSSPTTTPSTRCSRGTSCCASPRPDSCLPRTGERRRRRHYPVQGSGAVHREAPPGSTRESRRGIASTVPQLPGQREKGGDHQPHRLVGDRAGTVFPSDPARRGRRASAQRGREPGEASLDAGRQLRLPARAGSSGRVRSTAPGALRGVRGAAGRRGLEPPDDEVAVTRVDPERDCSWTA